MFNKYATWQLSCQNGCDIGKMQFEHEPTMLVQEIATGNVRAFCWSCVIPMSKPSGNDEKLLELRDEFVFWPVREEDDGYTDDSVCSRKNCPVCGGPEEQLED